MARPAKSLSLFSAEGKKYLGFGLKEKRAYKAFFRKARRLEGKRALRKALEEDLLALEG
ncbi:MAG: hypothetical protein ABDH20_12085 [Thermus sp.]